MQEDLYVIAYLDYGPKFLILSRLIYDTTVKAIPLQFRFYDPRGFYKTARLTGKQRIGCGRLSLRLDT